MGREVHYVPFTSGDKGSHDPQLRPGQVAAMRKREQRAAAMAPGARTVTFLHQPDGDMLDNTMELRRQLCGLIREMQPDLLLAIDPWRRYQSHSRPSRRGAVGVRCGLGGAGSGICSRSNSSVGRPGV